MGRNVTMLIMGFIFLLIIGLIIIFVPDPIATQNDYHSNDVEESKHDVSPKEEPKRQATLAKVEQIFQNAKVGKIDGVPIIAGESMLSEVLNEWGEPVETLSLDNRVYIDYPKENVSFGYQEEVVVDVRSFHDYLTNIHLQDIIKEKGEPEERRFYKDEEYNQLILVYNIGDYQLKWVLDNPTEEIPNPTVHHISVVMEGKGGESIVENMSLDEKVGQMILSGIEGIEVTDETTRLINQYKIGGVIFFAENLQNIGQSRRLVNRLIEENATNKLPLFLSVDQEGGRITRLPGGIHELPTNQEIGYENDAELSFNIGKVLGQQVKEFGMNLNFAPVLDINSNPNNPVINDRSFGPTATTVSKLGIQTMKGMQEENIIPVIKHFPGHGDTSVDSHLELPKVYKTMEELEELELIPFQDAINSGADVVMTAHILLPYIDPENPATMSNTILTDILREKLGFEGVVITDDMTMDAIEKNYDIGEAAVQSVKAGSDIILIAHEYDNVVNAIDSIKQAVVQGEVTEERIDASVRRIVELKEKYNISNGKIDEVKIEHINKQIEEIIK